MQTRHFFSGDGKQTEGVVVTQIQFGHEGKLGQVGQRFQIIRMHAFGFALFAIGRDVVIGVAHRPLQAFQLQSADFIAAGFFNRV